MTYIRFNDVHAYKVALELGNNIWKIVEHWNVFQQKTIGSQLASAADSISANLAEGFGRFHKADKIKFYHYSLGSRAETCDWIQKCFTRGLITQEQFISFSKTLEQLRPEIWMLIKITNEKLSI